MILSILRPTTLVSTFVATLFAAGALAATPSTSTRPQLTDAQASSQTILAYLAQFAPASAVVTPTGTPPSGPPTVTFTTDNWDPTAGVGDITKFKADFVVAADGSGNFTTVQAAITAAGNGTTRKYIAVKPGTYRGAVAQTSANASPVTLYGLGAFPSQVVIVNNFGNPESKPQTSPVTCGGSSTYGTSGSATVTVKANGFHAKNLTISNDYVRGTCPTATYSNQSAVALAVSGDQAIFENVRLLGHQDTLTLGSLSTVYRSYFLNSFIQGDTDFIFGAGTAVFNHCTINYTNDSLGSTSGIGMNFAPSTIVTNTHGFLVINSSLTASAGTAANSLFLARAWDQNVTTYYNGISPNGRLVVRDSVIGKHIYTAAPYTKSTSGRPYSSSPTCVITATATDTAADGYNCAPVGAYLHSPNLFFEYNNTTGGL
ncbi:pectinesterase family protein [Telmatospirillum sp.]|uniref:pectinesterase family protein n=1 Tax=Telmatospirillum sp. TaxID=2079197 RepID=UPI00284462EC|nr:pectinesterase family protein [Telmatospirillum sp.]MDR3436370.1 pectinesterase family protein [Telmatospirillum sp.]